MAMWNELKMLEDEKWKSKLTAEERKLKAEECMHLRRRGFMMPRKPKIVLSCSSIQPQWMKPQEKYWELTRGEILTQTEVSLQNGGGDGGRDDGFGGDGGHVHGGSGGDIFGEDVV
jgi:hypothetical protein